LTSLENLPEALLIETYEKAIDYKLDPRFINLLEKEMNRRGIEFSEVDKELVESI